LKIGRLIQGVTILFVFSAFACCQTPAGRSFVSGGRYQVAGTFSHVLTDETYVNAKTLNGWTASFSAPIIPLLRADIEAGDYYGGPHGSMKSVLVGPRFGAQINRFQPFVRGLFGVSHTAGVTPLTIAAGGGLDMILTEHISLRLLQVDYYRLHGGGAPDGADYLRMGFGVAYEFGSR